MDVIVNIMKLKNLIPLKEQKDSVSPLILKKVNVLVNGEKTDVSIRYNPYKDLQDVIISWGEESHTVDFDAEDVIDDHGNEGKDMSFVAFSENDKWRFIVDVSVEASYDMSGNIQEIMWDTLEIDIDDLKKESKMKKFQLRNIIRESIKELMNENLLTEITAQDCITQYPGARSAAIFDVNTGNINTMGHRLCLYNYQNPSVSPQVGMAFNQAGVIYRITEIAIPGQPLSVSTNPYSTLQGVTFINNNVDEVYGNECDPTLAVFTPIQSPQYGCVSQPPAVIEGCMDPLASNYDATATQDDGSCMYPAGSGTTATLDRGPQTATPDRTKNDPNVTQDNPQVRRMRELANIKK